MDGGNRYTVRDTRITHVEDGTDSSYWIIEKQAFSTSYMLWLLPYLPSVSSTGDTQEG
jgi:hypothetical protein